MSFLRFGKFLGDKTMPLIWSVNPSINDDSGLNWGTKRNRRTACNKQGVSNLNVSAVFKFHADTVAGAAWDVKTFATIFPPQLYW